MDDRPQQCYRVNIFGPWFFVTKDETNFGRTPLNRGDDGRAFYRSYLWFRFPLWTPNSQLPICPGAFRSRESTEYRRFDTRTKVRSQSRVESDSPYRDINTHGRRPKSFSRPKGSSVYTARGIRTSRRILFVLRNIH